MKANDNSTFENARDAFIYKKENMSLDFLHCCTLINEIENAIRFIRMSRLELNMSMNPATTETEEVVVDEIANISVPLTNDDVNFENSQLPLDMNMKNINSCNNDSSEKFLHELQVGSMSFEQM